MKAIHFKQQNIIMGHDQTEYKALPAFRGTLDMGSEEIIACYQLSEEEKAEVAKTGKIWLRQLVGRSLMQPQLPQVENPFPDGD